MHYRHIHFVGIGGIGMSGLAFLASCQNSVVSGCDIDIKQDTIDHLKNHDCKIYKGHGNTECFDKSIDLYVYSTRISMNSPEIVHAKNLGIKILHRAQFLNILLEKKKGIALTGTHGKTTTTSMLAHLLISAKHDPSVIVGAMVPSVGGNARNGIHGSLFVAEADESDRSLLELHAPIKLITTIDYEHPETYADLNDIQNTFKTFVTKKETEVVFACIDNQNINNLITSLKIPVITYSTKIATASVYCTEISLLQNSSTFFVHAHFQDPFFIQLPVPGLHNISNCLGAIAIALYLGISHQDIQIAFSTFQRPERRFSIRGNTKNGSIVVDDYAHHPAELEALIKTARRFANKNLTLIFQPHKYQRTQALWNDFIKTLSSEMIDHLYITDIYSSGEQQIEGINAAALAQSIKEKHPNKDVVYIPLDILQSALLKKNSKDEVLLFAGAGNVYQIGLKLVC